MNSRKATPSSREKSEPRRADQARVRPPLHKHAASGSLASSFTRLQNAAGNRAVSALAAAGISSAGQRMPATLRHEMERRFDYDFGAVRVHVDQQAAQSAEALSAKAFTFGQHIVFGQDRFSPDTQEGRRLLAHELAHVIQQARGGAPPALDPAAHHERAAGDASAQAVRSTGPVTVQGATGEGVAREREEWDIRVIPDPGAGKLRVVRVDEKGRILAGLAEVTPPRGASLDPNQVVADRPPTESGPDAGKPVVTIPEEWQTTTNPKQNVVVQKSSAAIVFGQETVMPEGAEERKRDRDEALAFVEERPWDVALPELYQWPNVVDDDAIKGLRASDAFKKWKEGKAWKEHQASIDRENRYYQQQLGGDLSPEEAREVWEQHHGPADATAWEQSQREAGTLPNAVRDPTTNEVIGYRTYESKEKYLAGGVGTLTEITLDREGKVVDRKETTVLTPATEAFQDIARNAPVTGTIINAAEVGGLSLDLRDPGRFLTEGERIDRAVSAVPFGDLARTGLEATTGVSASDKDIDALLADQPRILSERERKGKAAMFVASGAAAVVGGRAKVKLKGKGPKPATPRTRPTRTRPPAARPAVKARPPEATPGGAARPRSHTPAPPKPAVSQRRVPTSRSAAGTPPRPAPKAPSAAKPATAQAPSAPTAGQGTASPPASKAARAKRRTPQEMAKASVAERKAAERAAAEARGAAKSASDQAAEAAKKLEAAKKAAERANKKAAAPARSKAAKDRARGRANQAKAEVAAARRAATKAERASAKAAGNQVKAAQRVGAKQQAESVARKRAAEAGGKRVPATTMVGFGKKKRQELVEFWERKIKRTKSDALKKKYQDFKERVEKRERPHPKQSEMEMELFYKGMGGTPQKGFLHGRRYRPTFDKETKKWKHEHGSSVPDITYSAAMIEVKNFKIQNKAGLISKLKKQVNRRRETGPADVKNQAIILDLRGQRAHLRDINLLVRDVSKATQVPLEYIQVLTW